MEPIFSLPAYHNNFHLWVLTKMEEIPSDASDLAKEYGESHAAEVQDWWLKLRNVY